MAANLYIVGNTGVGKSLICNCLLQRWEFDSKNQADSCTREVSFVETWLPTSYFDTDGNQRKSALSFRIFNIPGLLEADPERVQQNVQLLESTLDRKEPSIILYVLTTEGGRVRDSDYAGFKALSEAYDLTKLSFMFIVNKCTKRDDQRCIETYIQKVMGHFRVGFLPHYDFTDQELQTEISVLATQVIPIIVDMIRPLMVAQLKKTNVLKLEANHIQDLKNESRQNKIKFEQEMNKLRVEINTIQNDNLQKTNELTSVKQALYAAQHAQQKHRRGGAFRLGPLSIEW